MQLSGARTASVLVTASRILERCSYGERRHRARVVVRKLITYKVAEIVCLCILRCSKFKALIFSLQILHLALRQEVQDSEAVLALAGVAMSYRTWAIAARFSQQHSWFCICMAVSCCIKAAC